MASAQSFDSLRRSLENGRPAPVYALYGQEGYYIDVLVREFEKLIPEEDKQFAQFVFYAPETEPGRIIDQCRQLPMMTERQVVIVKECQSARADQLDKLRSYVEAPSDSTVLVLCWRGGEIKGASLKAALKKSAGAVAFESKKVYENNIPALVASYLRDKGLCADAKAMEMLRDYIGTDLSRLYNELDKLASILPPRAAVTPEVVERHVGVSRDYNSYEIVDAIAAKDAAKVFRIAEYFRANPKAAPLVMVGASIFGYFADLMVAWYAPDRSDRGIQEALGLKTSFQVRRFRQGLSYYPPFAVVEIIDAIRRFDVQCKGVGSRQDAADLFRDLLYHILTTDGSNAKRAANG
ncbi:MAG: DNA polymerase III subunit delta [Muribaculaceae bacterium]|nr:DNA polymerase III subunit delta [Muribaculaceae bacterium]